MSDVREALLALKAARDISPSFPVMVSITYNQNPRGFFTLIGSDIKTTVNQLEEAGADVIGSNCGNGSPQMIQIGKEILKHTSKPVVIQPNAGIPELKGGKTIYPETPQFMAQKAEFLIETGISIIGGCCGTTPEHIKAIKEVILSKQSKS